MNDLRRTLRAVRTAAPQDDLREATLARAHSAWSDAPQREHWIDRLWTNRRLRLAWALALLFLAVLDVVATPGAVPGLSRSGPTLADARLAFADFAASIDPRPERRFGS